VNVSAFPSIGVALNSAGTLAAMTLNTAVAVVDLTNPAAPILLGTCPLPARALAVTVNSAGTFAYVAAGSTGHLQIINLSTRTLAASLSMAGTQLDIALAETPSTTTAYLVSQTGMLQVVDVTNPSAPALKGSAGLSGFGARVAVEGSLATVLSFDSSNNDYLDLVNVTNPLQPLPHHLRHHPA
jgi:hypothetical protein